MAHSLRKETLSFYPPRSRWYSRPFFSFWHRLRVGVGLGNVSLPAPCSIRQLLLSLTVPGFAFFISRQFLVGWCFLAGYLAMGLLFIGALGFLAGAIGYGLMISLHATSVVYYEGHWLGQSRFSLRVAVALLTLFGVWGLIYAPASRYAQQHWAMPVRVGNQVVVLNRALPPGALRRDDWVGYEIAERRGGEVGERAVYLRSGLSLDRLLALPGDQVRFTRQALFVNGIEYGRAQFMPAAGEFVVPEKVWFIWPNLAINRAGAASESTISATLQQTAMVAQSQILGRPFKHWFGRRQLP